MSAEKLRELKTLASVCPELNMANYTEDDVRHLNDWAIEMSLLVEQYALSQQPDNAACKSVQKRLAAQQPATGEPVASRNPFAARCYTMSESHLSGHRLIVGFENLGDVQDAHEWVARQGRGDFTHPAPSVPDDVVRVPVQVLKDAGEALGNFVSDHGWGDADMQAMDNLDAYIARHEANRAAMLAAK